MQLHQSDAQQRADGQVHNHGAGRAFGGFQTRQDSRIVVDSDDDDDMQDTINDEFDPPDGLEDKEQEDTDNANVD